MNHLSTALLALLLTPNLSLAAKGNSTMSRLVIVSSSTHYWSTISNELSERGILETLNDESYCTPALMRVMRYAETKREYHRSTLSTTLSLMSYNPVIVLNVLFTRALAEHLPATSPIVPTAVCPGFCVSELRRSMTLADRIYYWFMEKAMARTAEQGSRQLLYAALGPDGKEGDHIKYMKGAYIRSTTVTEPSDFVISKEGKHIQHKMWVSCCLV